MTRFIKTSLSVATILTLISGCSKSSTAEAPAHITNSEHSSEKKSEKSHWGYIDEVAPEYWGELSENYALCSNGNMQTPINIIATEDVNITPLDFNYTANATTVINNGHTIQVNIDSGSSVQIDGVDFKLLQFHFHTPSENNINGDKFPLEAHFVHQSSDGDLAVVAVMFEKGDSNPIIEKIWSKFPLEEEKEVSLTLSANDIKAIMPSDKDYYKFMGSLTTPPCSENVKWNVFKTSVTISSEQVETFFNIFGHTNNRPIQETNNRNIQE